MRVDGKGVCNLQLFKGEEEVCFIDDDDEDEKSRRILLNE
jgi:hypothetical protein